MKPTFKQFINEQEAVPGRPYWLRDQVRKAYIVYDKDGVERSVHPYEHEYDISTQYYAAVRDVNELRDQDLKADKHQDQHIRPLTKFEVEFIELKRKFRKYFKLLKGADAESQAIYEEQLEKWGDRMKTLADARLIRDSVLSGEHEATRDL